MSLAAFGTNALDLHFGIVTFIIEFKIIKFFGEREPGNFMGITGVIRMGFFNFMHESFPYYIIW